MEDFTHLKQKAYHGLIVYGEYDIEQAKRLTDFDELRRMSAVYTKIPLQDRSLLRTLGFKPEVAIVCNYVHYLTFLRANSHFYLEVTDSDKNQLARAFLFSANVETHKQILLEMGI